MTYRHDDDGRSLATGWHLFFLLLCFCAFVSAHFLSPALMFFYCLHCGLFYLFISLFARLILFRRSDWDILADGSNLAFIPSHLFPLPRFLSKITIIVILAHTTHSHSSSSHRHHAFSNIPVTHHTPPFFLGRSAYLPPLYVPLASKKKSIKK
jgi:hypothetical protein